jgi:SAM-dependent methyltransferase
LLTNAYSPEWFSLFLHRVAPERTAREVAFVDQHLAPGSLVLDAPCGSGRHALLLVDRGHRVLALDRAASLLGPVADPSLAWICADLRALPLASGRLDAILCLWQSFGYFAAEENAELLQRWSDLARPGGRLILDLYHRGFFEANQGERWVELGGRRVRETRVVREGRLVVDLAYGSPGRGDRFEWQLFTPEELAELASGCGWELQLACSGFDARQTASAERPRAQYVLIRPPA